MTASASATDQPHEAFSALGNELRIDILSALVAYEQDAPDEMGISFADLRKRIGVKDPSKFNYHLKQLRGHFVENADDGYHLTNSGRRVVSAVRSGELTQCSRKKPSLIAIDCPDCHSSLRASYERDRFLLNCPTHGSIGKLPLPPGVATNRSAGDAYHVASMCGDWYIEAVQDGFCPICWDDIETTLPVEGESNVSEACAYAGIEGQSLAGFSCTGCWMTLYAPVGAVVVRHPAVSALFYNNGLDLSKKSIFEIDFIWSSDTVRHVSTDPTRVQVNIRVGDDGLQLVLDEDAAVIEVEFIDR